MGALTRIIEIDEVVEKGRERQNEKRIIMKRKIK
jgi:hypothetical protein